jgi:hypothetical protein
MIRRGGGSKILGKNFLQPALTGWSRLAPRWGLPKVVKKIFLQKIFDRGGDTYYNSECLRLMFFIKGEARSFFSIGYSILRISG